MRNTILGQIDDLMTGFTGGRGVGNEKSLQWSGRHITAFAQVLKPKLAALAVSISVSVLKSGQHRAFRDSIRCPGYSADAVERIELQFAGGH